MVLLSETFHGEFTTGDNVSSSVFPFMLAVMLFKIFSRNLDKVALEIGVVLTRGKNETSYGRIRTLVGRATAFGVLVRPTIAH